MTLWKTWKKNREIQENIFIKDKFGFDNYRKRDIKDILQKAILRIYNRFPEETIQFLDSMADRDYELKSMLKKSNLLKTQQKPIDNQPIRTEDDIVPAGPDSGYGIVGGF